MVRALGLIDEIGATLQGYAGGGAAKFQAVFPETLCAPNAPTYFAQVGEQAETQREFFARTRAFGPGEFTTLAARCREVGIDFLCTPFDVPTIDWLAPLVPAFKVASADITNAPLLAAIRATGKPVYLSTGASTKDEIAQAVRGDLAGSAVTVLHCVLAYPTPTEQAHLGMMVDLGMDYPHVGWSDHTQAGTQLFAPAWLLGAEVIEKHYTDDLTALGNDHYHSMNRGELRAAREYMEFLDRIIGQDEKGVLPCELPAREHARRGLYAARDIPAGRPIRAEDIAILRPPARLGPGAYRELLGTVLEGERKIGQPL